MMAWGMEHMATAVKIKTLRDAGFSNRDIIEAKKADLVDELTKGKEG